MKTKFKSGDLTYIPDEPAEPAYIIKHKYKSIYEYITKFDEVSDVTNFLGEQIYTNIFQVVRKRKKS